MKRALLLIAGLTLAGCNTSNDLNTEPTMSRVGAALPLNALAPEPAMFRDPNSTYVHGGEGLFRDSRAHQIGDVLTVLIQMNDKAALDNSSERSRVSSAGIGAGFGFSVDGEGSDASFNGSANSSSKSKGEGAVERSEAIKVTLAAVVTSVLPNGNLIISGSQEMRVNFEMRVVNIQGIVRQRDISGNNVVPYEKIAEARISYGGRGRLTEVQQPGVLHQIYDRVAPF